MLLVAENVHNNNSTKEVMCATLFVYPQHPHPPTTDTRYEMDDPKGLGFIKLVQETVDSLQGPIVFFNLFPSLASISPPFLKAKLGYYRLEKNVNELIGVMSVSAWD